MLLDLIKLPFIALAYILGGIVLAGEWIWEEGLELLAPFGYIYFAYLVVEYLKANS